MIEVLLVAPYTSVRAGLRVLLEGFADISVAGEARDVETLRYLLDARMPDAIVYDSGADDLDSLLDLLADHALPFVALCDDTDDVADLADRRQHSWCALHRAAGGDEIAAGIRAASAGLVALDAGHVRAFPPCEWSEHRHTAQQGEFEPGLTPREREVLQLMAQGLPNKNIAARLKISLSTAKFHVASILAKLDAASRTEAVTIGARRGLITL